MRLLILSILLGTAFASTHSLAAEKKKAYPATNITTYYHYNDKPLKLSPESFRRYARPQLKSMLSEYYHILKKSNSIHANLVQLKNIIFELDIQFKVSHEVCVQKELVNCEEELKSFYKISRELANHLNSIQKNRIKYKKINDGNPFNLDSVLNLSRLLNKIDINNYKLLHMIEEYLITINTPYFPYFEGKNAFNVIMHDMSFSADQMITSQLPTNIRDEFDFIWTNFFRPMDTKVIKERDFKFLIKRLDEFNGAWNSFHKNMTKGTISIPKSQVQLIKIMHNRWNSVLKVILRT